MEREEAYKDPFLQSEKSIIKVEKNKSAEKDLSISKDIVIKLKRSKEKPEKYYIPVI